jgi:hypothetical protein
MDEKAIIKIQSIFRMYLAKKNNIFYTLRNTKVKENFEKELKGYHIMNSTALKEASWEIVNCNIVEEYVNITDASNGNHLSGKDNKFNNWNISNKTCKIKKGMVSLSSYRLTGACSIKDHGITKTITAEIKRRDASFDYYSILLREEYQNYIEYRWYIVPKDYFIFKINPSDLTPKHGKKGVVGWKSDYASITFSMSSQLWFNFKIDLINKYLIHKVVVYNGAKKIKYSEIYDHLSSSKSLLLHNSI